MSAGVGYVRRDYPMISEMCWQPLSCVLIKIERGLWLFRWFFGSTGDFGNAHGDCNVLWKLGVSWASFSRNKTEDQNHRGEISIHTLFRSDSPSVYYIYILIHSHTHAVNLLIEHHSFSWFFFNLQPVGSKHLISLLFVHRIFKPSNLKGGRGRIQWEKNAKNMGPPYIYSLKKMPKDISNKFHLGLFHPSPTFSQFFFTPPKKNHWFFPLVGSDLALRSGWCSCFSIRVPILRTGNKIPLIGKPMDLRWYQG